MTQDPNGTFRAPALQAVQALGRVPGLIARAAVLPGIVALAATYGIQTLDQTFAAALYVVHAAMALAYLTALARIAMGTYPGFGVLGLAVPRPVWPGVRPALAIAGEALVLIIPAVVIVFAVLGYAIVPIARVDSVLLDAVVVVAVEYFLLTLLGLVLGTGLLRHGPGADRA